MVSVSVEVGLLPLIVAFAIVCRFAKHDAFAVILAQAEQRLAFGVVPGVLIDDDCLTLVDMFRPAKFILVIVPAVVRFVQHVASMLILGLAIVMACAVNKQGIHYETGPIKNLRMDAIF